MPLLKCFDSLTECSIKSEETFAEGEKFTLRCSKDWWNSTSFAAYYRTWNVVVHDWLYTYVYKEVFRVGVVFARDGKRKIVGLADGQSKSYCAGNLCHSSIRYFS